MAAASSGMLVGIDEHPAVPHHFGKRPAIRRDQRDARRHRFERRQAEALVERREAPARALTRTTRRVARR